MRVTTALPLLVLAVAGVLGGALWGLRHERLQFYEDFTATQQALARQLASDLSNELRDIDEDVRLVSQLVEREPASPAATAASRNTVTSSTFDALAAVVRHYRAIVLVGRGQGEVSAVDPTESPESARRLLAWAREAAAHARTRGGPVLEGLREDAVARQFYVYALPSRSGEVVAVVSEARLFLQPMLRPRNGQVTYVLIDPSRALWTGCSELGSCRALAPEEWRRQPELASLMSQLEAPSGTSWRPDALSAAVGLAARPAVAAWEAFPGPAGGRWSIAVLASTAVLDARERSLVRRLLLTSGALALALGAIGAFMIRHQRRSAVLAERLRNAQQLAHLREKSDRIMENVPAGLAGVTRDGRLVLANAFLSERAGAVAVGAPMESALRDADPGAARKLRAAIEEALRLQRARFLKHDDLLLFGAKPGHFDVRIIPLKQPADDVSALVLFEDLSERRSLEEQLVRAEKLATVGVLTAGLAHEIGTPLGIIRGRAEVLLGKVRDPGLARDLESVIRQIDHIGSTIRQLLDFSRAQPVDVRPVDAEEAMAEALRLLEWRFRQKAVAVQVEAGPSLPRIAADPDQLQQVLVNLLINALDACAQGGRISVRLALADDGASLRMDISDDGCGIPADELNAVFDPFFTTKKRGEGTGLGLPVAASIVRNHSGEIALASDPQAGTTATVVWPAAREAA
jgi:signal transduction histidine kinase